MSIQSQKGGQFDRMLECLSQIVAAVPVPVTADFGAGYGASPEDVAATVRGAIEAGEVSCNIEDATGRSEQPLFDFDLACDRIRAVGSVQRQHQCHHGQVSQLMRRACLFPFSALCLALMAGCAPQPERPSPAPVVVAKPAARPGSGSKMSGKDIQAITAYHDKVRADVGVGPIKWSPALAAYAQEWADHLAATDCRMVHHTEGKYGENLFQGTAGHFTAVDAAKAWEAEKKDYHGGVLTQSNWHPAGHYTQMVWRDTNALGCGEAICNKTLIVSCNYDPPGNYLGRRPY